MTHYNVSYFQNISNVFVDYQNLIPKHNGFVFKFIKKNNKFIHTFAEGDFLKKVEIPPSLIVGKTLHELLPENQANEKQSFYEKAWSGSIINYEGNINGFYYLSSLTPVIVNSQVVEVNGTAIEITEHRKNTLKIQELEKLSLIGELAAGVAHEIRNPLTSVTGFAQMIKELSNDKTIDHYIEIVLTELNRINAIVNEFIFIAKPKENMKTRETDIKALVSHVVEFMKPQATLNGVHLIESIHFDQTLTIQCDPNQITQVLMNLIQNAIEATTDPSTQEIVISLKNGHSDSFLIEITDKGSGISQERQKRLFEPFYTTKEKGTGLGLMMCKRIIENHNGTIEINSQLGEGTTVRINLPTVFDHQQLQG
ncbi:ATP-binding protein [Bacillus sp. FJAT-27231]|uniref:ATP-binding protein n=1 Tax=Bacillus sp. FJAT-27231 TaxID=1679168 RepID=UPI0006707C49|nr:ATP-binding protein [Bacillus sp. FJAT-27231]